jgi:diadenosine tetraphosphate (Ap4A) HIT family hydrolase
MSESQPADCPFCHLPAGRILAANAVAVAIRDAYPVVPGHTLIVSRRHVADFFDLTPEEFAGLLELLGEVKRQLDAEQAPEGYNVGVNVGRAAGQTVLHVHVHLIPRRQGDVQDPVGGVRNVIPGRGAWSVLTSQEK